jgi:hypothetical protein
MKRRTKTESLSLADPLAISSPSLKQQYDAASTDVLEKAGKQKAILSLCRCLNTTTGVP